MRALLILLLAASPTLAGVGNMVADRNGLVSEGEMLSSSPLPQPQIELYASCPADRPHVLFALWRGGSNQPTTICLSEAEMRELMDSAEKAAKHD